MFVGLQFIGDDWSNSSTAPINSKIDKLELTNGIYDGLFGSLNINIAHDNSSLYWDFYTRFYAQFKNTLNAGNVDYSSQTVTSIKIKRRKSNEYKWITLAELPITNNQDFNFEYFDFYAQGNQEYEYSIVPVSNDVEGNLNLNSVHSDFNDFYLLDKDVSYHIFINTKLNTTINKPTSIISTLGRKYPFYISNGKNNYKTGTLSFTLLPLKECEFDMDAAYEYRILFEDWLTNGKPKILKDFSGQMFMINITDTISIDFSDIMLPVYSINFTEIGSALDVQDLYTNGFVCLSSILNESR